MDSQIGVPLLKNPELSMVLSLEHEDQNTALGALLTARNSAILMCAFLAYSGLVS